jgi:hypothetical protein
MSDEVPDGNNGMDLPNTERVANKLKELSQTHDTILTPDEQGWLNAADCHLRRMSDDGTDDPNRKHTTGTIDGYGFSLRVDGDAPDELVADIEAALADVKAEVEE